jgi:CHC2 zinc finger
VRPDKRKAPDGTGADAKTTEGGPQQRSATPLTDEEIRALGFDPTRRGWVPFNEEAAQRVAVANARRYEGTASFRIPGDPVPCTLCDEPAEPSTVGMPVCGGICAAVLMHQLIAEIGDALYSKADGSGGTAPVRPITPPPSRRRLSEPPRGPFSIERARERVGDCRDVLERHGVDVRWGRTARCPFHDDQHPSMSLYERHGRSRAHCFPCDFDGDALDLEAALSGEDLATTIRRWG